MLTRAHNKFSDITATGGNRSVGALTHNPFILLFCAIDIIIHTHTHTLTQPYSAGLIEGVIFKSAVNPAAVAATERVCPPLTDSDCC